MSVYMSQFSYTPEAWTALGRDPVDRREGINALMQQVGGRLIELYYAFGEYDGVLLFEAPDDASAAAALLAAIGAGHLKSNRTTKLLTVEEALEALRKVKDLSFRGPSPPR
jgi:uncharacterized protein with GYD domain